MGSIGTQAGIPEGVVGAEEGQPLCCAHTGRKQEEEEGWERGRGSRGNGFLNCGFLKGKDVPGREDCGEKGKNVVKWHRECNWVFRFA